MSRKDCEISLAIVARRGSRRAPAWIARVAWIAAGAMLVVCPARAASVRVWPTAVVVDDGVRLDDVCELRGFDAETERNLAALKLGDAPRPGGSRILHISLLRDALSAGGANLAQVTLGGATECVVTRPSAPEAPSPRARTPRGPAPGLESPAPAQPASVGETAADGAATLRHAVAEFFDGELQRYGGRAELVFDHTSERVLDLSGPTYSFAVRRRGGPALGLVPLEVDVRNDGDLVQTVPLVVQVSMVRPVVTAARAINQEAAIGEDDVQVVPLTFNRTDRLGVSDPGPIVGKRAKRFIPAGTVIDPATLESVPLVVRGQFVTLISQVGPVRVVTSGKAADSGSFGDVVRVRAMDNRRVEFHGVVAGPAKVQVGAAADRHADAGGEQTLAASLGVRP